MESTCIMLVAHAPIASSIARAAAHVLGEAVPALLPVDVGAIGQHELLVRECLEGFAGGGWRDLLIVTDLVGGTPCNVAVKVAAQLGARAQVVAGLHLAMLLALLEQRDGVGLHTLARIARIEGRRWVISAHQASLTPCLNAGA